MHSPVSAFHTFKVRSVLPLITVVPDIWEDQTPPVWPHSVRRHCNNTITRLHDYTITRISHCSRAGQLVVILTLPVTADHTFSVLSSEPLTILFPENCRHVMTWSSWPLSTFGGRIGFVLQFILILCCLMYACFQGEALLLPGAQLAVAHLALLRLGTSLRSSIPAARHFSFHSRLSSARKRQERQVWAARRRSRGSRKASTDRASSFGSREMKSR
jgi:hypothetical protein